MFTDTINLRTIPPLPQPSPELPSLLHELLRHALGVLPGDAREVFDANEIPGGLRRVAHIAQSFGQICSCWRDSRNRFWLFAGQIMPELSAQRGMLTLRLDHFEGEEGALLDSAYWVLESPGSWSRIDD
jgi:hypothetical protein